jgi:hypothetical protein
MPEAIVADPEGSLSLHIKKISAVLLTLTNYEKLEVLHFFSITPLSISEYRQLPSHRESSSSILQFNSIHIKMKTFLAVSLCFLGSSLLPAVIAAPTSRVVRAPTSPARSGLAQRESDEADQLIEGVRFFHVDSQL